MVGIKYLLVVPVLTVGLAGTAWANMAPVPERWQPDSAKSANAAPLRVIVDHHQAQTRLMIPKQMLSELPDLQQVSAAVPSQQANGSLRNRTVVAGTTLSLLLAGGVAVVVLVRQRKGRAAMVTSIVLLMLLGVFAKMAVANLPAPPVERKLSKQVSPNTNRIPSMIPIPNSFMGDLVIQPVAFGNRATLIIGRDLADSFSKIKAPPTTGPGVKAAPQPTPRK